ncbi:hypothetical protein PMAYCL1PPCAC_13629, partial [Pristionchus mayeri]
GEFQISIWTMYLSWEVYGPYEATKGGATTLEKVNYEKKNSGRVDNIRELLENPEFIQQKILKFNI